MSRRSDPPDAVPAREPRGEDGATPPDDADATDQPDAAYSIDEVNHEALPWSVKLLGIAFGLYLLMRIIQMLGWLVRWLSG